MEVEIDGRKLKAEFTFKMFMTYESTLGTWKGDYTGNCYLLLCSLICNNPDYKEYLESGTEEEKQKKIDNFISSIDANPDIYFSFVDMVVKKLTWGKDDKKKAAMR